MRAYSGANVQADRRRVAGRIVRLLGSVALGSLLAAPAVAQTASDGTVEEVIVTGTSLRGVQPTGSGLVSIQREDIMAIGAPTTADLLTKAPQLNSFNTAPRPALGGLTGPSTVPGLRGLPVGATLILLDGQRITADSPLQTPPDPSSIPPAAIERVEVVADGASAIYGSDAVAGVINIITRRNLDGAETSIRVGRAQNGYDTIDLSQAFGRTWSGGSAMLVVAYAEHDRLTNAALPYYTEDLRAFGGIDLRPTNCPTPNVVISGVNYAPPTYAPGVAARCSANQFADTLPDTRRTSIVGSVRHEVTDKLSLHGSVRYAAIYLSSNIAAPAASLAIPSTNPFFQAFSGGAPTTETVLFNLRPITGQQQNHAFGKSGNAVIGGEYKLPKDWRLNASINYGWSDSAGVGDGVNSALLAAAAAGTTTLTALDPFGGRTDANLRARISDFENVFAATQKLYDYQIKADGALWALPGGEVKLAVGAAFRRHKYDALATQGPRGTNGNFNASSAVRDTKALFAETFVPLVGPDNAMPLAQAVNLSAAVRYDDYSDFGSTVNPKFGLTWAPVEDLVLRGSYGKSYHAPDVGDVYAVDNRANFIARFAVVPPGSAPTDTIVLAGGAPNLRPEKAETYSIGADFTPSWIPGLRASVTYYNIKYKDQVGLAPGTTDIFTNPAFRSFVTLNPTRAQLDALIIPGRLVLNTTTPIPSTVGQILDRRRQNLGATNTYGIDFDGSYRWNTDYGSWAAGVAGNRILNFDLQTGVGSPFVPQRQIVRTRVRGNVAWTNGPFAAGAALNYTGRFNQSYASSAGGAAVQRVKPFITLDVNGAYDLPDDGLLGGTSVSINVDNALNERPPVALISGGYSLAATPLGRTVWLGLQKKW